MAKNWQETVIGQNYDCQGLLETQARITWQARQQEVDEAEQRGIRKVVEWIKSNSEIERCDPDTEAYSDAYRWVSEEGWQDFLKGEIKPVKEGKDDTR